MRVKRLLIEKFNNAEVLQPTSDVLILRKQAQQAQSGLRKFGNALAAEIKSEFELGDLKELTRCFKKVAKKYHGDAARLHDITRGRIPLIDLAKINAMDRILNPERQSPFLAKMANLGYFVRDYQNLFENPSVAGVRGIDAKIEIPLSNSTFHIAEIQGRHPGMEPAYIETHAIMEQQREEFAFDPCAKEVSREYAAQFHAAAKARRVIHDKAAEAAGLTILEKPLIDFPPCANLTWRPKTLYLPRNRITGSYMNFFAADAFNTAQGNIVPLRSLEVFRFHLVEQLDGPDIPMKLTLENGDPYKAETPGSDGTLTPNWEMYEKLYRHNAKTKWPEISEQEFKIQLALYRQYQQRKPASDATGLSFSGS